jgi:hypothetical protein
MTAVNTPSDTNFLSPNKFLLSMNRFPNVKFYAQSCPLPGYTTGSVYIPTGAEVDFYEIGDKLKFSDFRVDFILDKEMQTLRELLKWSYQSQTKSRKNFNPFSDISVLACTNNSNPQFLWKLHNCFPYQLTDVDFSTKKSPDQPVTMEVLFKFSHYSFDEGKQEGVPYP